MQVTALSSVSALASASSGGVGGGAEAFNRALEAAQAKLDAMAEGKGPSLQNLVSAIEGLNGEGERLAAAASAAQAKGNALSPGDMIELTMRCNEFMFHCELTSNVANRSSDGLQQLFREQG